MKNMNQKSHEPHYNYEPKITTDTGMFINKHLSMYFQII